MKKRGKFRRGTEYPSNKHFQIRLIWVDWTQTSAIQTKPSMSFKLCLRCGIITSVDLRISRSSYITIQYSNAMQTLAARWTFNFSPQGTQLCVQSHNHTLSEIYDTKTAGSFPPQFFLGHATEKGPSVYFTHLGVGWLVGWILWLCPSKPLGKALRDLCDSYNKKNNIFQVTPPPLVGSRSSKPFHNDH